MRVTCTIATGTDADPITVDAGGRSRLGIHPRVRARPIAPLWRVRRLDVRENPQQSQAVRLDIKIPASGDPTSPENLALVEGTIAEKASAWTAPVYVGTVTDNGTTYFEYTTDAVPRGILTTANIPAVLRPPHIAR